MTHLTLPRLFQPRLMFFIIPILTKIHPQKCLKITKENESFARISFKIYIKQAFVYHQYSVPTILQVVTPISFLKKISFVSFLG